MQAIVRSVKVLKLKISLTDLLTWYISAGLTRYPVEPRFALRP
jgi:hypothetical protein